MSPLLLSTVRSASTSIFVLVHIQTYTHAHTVTPGRHALMPIFATYYRITEHRCSLPCPWCAGHMAKCTLCTPPSLLPIRRSSSNPNDEDLDRIPDSPPLQHTSSQASPSATDAATMMRISSVWSTPPGGALGAGGRGGAGGCGAATPTLAVGSCLRETTGMAPGIFWKAASREPAGSMYTKGRHAQAAYVCTQREGVYRKNAARGEHPFGHCVLTTGIVLQRASCAWPKGEPQGGNATGQ